MHWRQSRNYDHDHGIYISNYFFVFCWYFPSIGELYECKTLKADDQKTMDKISSCSFVVFFPVSILWFQFFAVYCCLSWIGLHWQYYQNGGSNNRKSPTIYTWLVLFFVPIFICALAIYLKTRRKKKYIYDKIANNGYNNILVNKLVNKLRRMRE